MEYMLLMINFKSLIINKLHMQFIYKEFVF